RTSGAVEEPNPAATMSAVAPDREGVVPLEFLRRKSSAAPAASPVPASRRAAPMPEEAVAQEHQLRLTYAGKTSEGVRLKSAPEAMETLPGMLGSLARSPVEVVEALNPDLGHASPSIVRSDEARLWLQAHAIHSRI